MISDAGRIVRDVDFAEVTPLVTLANPILSHGDELGGCEAGGRKTLKSDR